MAAAILAVDALPVKGISILDIDVLSLGGRRRFDIAKMKVKKQVSYVRPREDPQSTILS